MIVSRGSFLKFNHCPGGGSAHDSVRGGTFSNLITVHGGTY